MIVLETPWTMRTSDTGKNLVIKMISSSWFLPSIGSLDLTFIIPGPTMQPRNWEIYSFLVLYSNKLSGSDNNMVLMITNHFLIEETVKACELQE